MEAEDRAGVRSVGHLGLDVISAQEDRCEIAMAEALHADHRASVSLLLLPGEELLGPEAVAHRADADPDRVDRHAQEGVEGDHLVDLAAADVHVVGEGVRELGRDGADLPAHPAEVVQEARAVGGKLRQELGELQDVYFGG